MNWDKVRLEFKAPHYDGTCGGAFWRCPFCNCEFFGGGPALHDHDENCLNEVGYDQMVYVLTPRAIVRILSGYSTTDGCNLETYMKSEIPQYVSDENLAEWREKYK